MLSVEHPRLGYVVKRYPRYSETFIVNEILAHEAQNLAIDIFALGTSEDTHFQDAIARVRAPLTCLRAEGLRGADFWGGISAAAQRVPGLMAALDRARGEPAREVYQAAMLARHAVERGIGLLHAHFASSAANVARMAARFAGIPYTFTAHAKDIFHEDVRDLDLRMKLREAAATVTVSDFNHQYLRRTFGDDAARVRRVYNGLDLVRFAFQPGRRERRIVAVGRLVEKKGFDDLIRAAAILRPSAGAFRCDIVGQGECEGALRGLISELGIGDTVHLLGPMPQAQVIELVRSSAVFAAPCVVGKDGNRDGLPTVLLEAMALGTACVATPVTGIPEVLRDGQTGLLVPERNPQALAGAIGRLLDQQRLADELSRSARALIEREFDGACTSAQLRQVFVTAMAGGNHR